MKNFSFKKCDCIGQNVLIILQNKKKVINERIIFAIPLFSHQYNSKNILLFLLIFSF